MRVYRERRSVERPPGAVASDVFGAADERRRTVRRLGLYRTETVLDTSTGSVRTTATAPGVAAATVGAVALAGIGVAVPVVRVVALWVAALAVVVPLGHLLPGVDERPDTGRVTERHVTPATAPAFAAAVGLLWLTLVPALGRAATAFCAVLLLVGAACYVIGAGVRTASVSALWLPAAGVLPVVSAFGALAVTSTLQDQAPTRYAVAAGAAVAFVSVALVTGYSYLVCRSLRDARFSSLPSMRHRAGLLVGYLSAVLLLVALVVDLLASVAGRFGVPVAVVLGSPLLLPVGGWAVDAAGTAVARVEVARRARRTTVDGVDIFVLDFDRPLVRAVSVPRGVLVSRRVVEALPDDELRAIVAHERHHLDARGRLLRVAVGLGAVLVGRNPLVAFLDPPSRELAADRRAARSAGRDPLIRSLRRLEGLDRPPATAPTPFAAPHALLYGPVADAAVHPSVDERVGALE